MSASTSAGHPVRVAVDGTASATRRTLVALLASALAIVPLKGVLSDNSWLIDVWLTMLVAVGPAALLRMRRPASALDVWPGIVLMVPWLTARFLAGDAIGAVIPGGAAWDRVGVLLDQLHQTTTNGVAPIHSTTAVRLVLCALLGLLAALIDLIAVVGRRGALAGVPVLVVYTVAGAVPRHPVSWLWFAIAAVGYLLLLGLDADDETRAWGRLIRPADAPPTRRGPTVSASRIGAIAVVVAVVLPFVVPAQSHNVLANAFHGGGGSGDGKGGFGAVGTSGSISPYVDLKGQLTRGKPIDLANVQISGNPSAEPFYLRTNVLDHFTGKGWRVSDHGDSELVGATSYDTRPATDGRASSVSYSARIDITGLTGNAPVFAVPQTVSGLDGAEWSPQDQLLLGSDDVHSGLSYTETAEQLAPTVDDLESAPSATQDFAPSSRWLDLPATPRYVTDLVKRLTSGASTDYDKAQAISRFFTNPDNGFVYSLKTKAGDSGNDLVDFLKNRTGFCQQYAGAMAVMLREAGVPSRVVLGYMHPAADKHGRFSITSDDAHSWVEAYFNGIGWVPFDPTPVAGLAAGQSGDLPWAPHSFPSSKPGSTALPSASVSNSSSAPAPSRSSEAPLAAAPGPRSGGSGGPPTWPFVLAGLVVLVGVLLTPAGLRAGRRRRRFAAARHGDTDAVWTELSDTATDLGYAWSPARTPRQVSRWLGRDADAAALDALALAVERGRYGRTAGPVDGTALARDLHTVIERLTARRAGRTRWQARVWPASLGWTRWGATAPRRH